MSNAADDKMEDVGIMLTHFKVSNRRAALVRGSVQFIIEDFGLIVCYVDRMDYVQVKSTMENKFPDWRITFISDEDDINEVKYKILWELMRCGYMKWLRYTYPRQLKNVLLGYDNLGDKIIKERLRLWANRPKFKYLIDDNMIALQNGVHRELTSDPSFFDYMPEEV